jgi:ankyrin repeat protein
MVMVTMHSLSFPSISYDRLYLDPSVVMHVFDAGGGPADWTMAAQAAIVAFHQAMGAHDIETVARMLDEDPRLLSSVWAGESPLTRAIRGEHVSMVRLLLEKGADVNTPDAQGTPALHIAAGRRHEDVVSLLLTSGADVSRANRSGYTPLMNASTWGHVGVVRLLLRYMGGRELDVRCDGGWTALYYACFHGRADVLRVLLLAGADHTIANIYGETARQIAQWNNHPQ